LRRKEGKRGKIFVTGDCTELPSHQKIEDRWAFCKKGGFPSPARRGVESRLTSREMLNAAPEANTAKKRKKKEKKKKKSLKEGGACNSCGKGTPVHLRTALPPFSAMANE